MQSGGCKQEVWIFQWFPKYCKYSVIQHTWRFWCLSQKFLWRQWHLHHVINYTLSQDYKQEQQHFCFQGESWHNLASMIHKVAHCHQTVWWWERVLVSRSTDNREFKVLGFKETLSTYKGTKFDFHMYSLVLPKILFSIYHYNVHSTESNSRIQKEPAVVSIRIRNAGFFICGLQLTSWAGSTWVPCRGWGVCS